MTYEQRTAVSEMLKLPPQEGQPDVEQMRAGFAAMMATMHISSGIRTSPTRLAGRPAVLVEPDGPVSPGTILYFHGGSFVIGPPKPRCR